MFGLAIIVFGLSNSFALSLCALATLGAGDMVSVYIRHMLIQLETPDEIRGRVSAVNAVFIGASNELGEFESGVTAVWFGLVPSVVFGGAATIAVTGAVDAPVSDVAHDGSLSRRRAEPRDHRLTPHAASHVDVAVRPRFDQMVRNRDRSRYAQLRSSR